MTLPQLQQKIGTIQRETTKMGRLLELSDRIAETCGYPQQEYALVASAILRGKLMNLFTELHRLEARLPTPELLSERAYNRMIALGFEVEAAEAERFTTYRAATKEPANG